MVRFLVGVALLLALVVGVILLEGGNPSGFIAIASFIVVFGPAVCAAFAVWKPAAIGQAFRDALGTRNDATAARSARVWALLERMFIIWGIIGWLSGAVLILSRVSADTAELGRAFAISIIGPIYGVFFAILSRILHARTVRP
jgi:flagellar motor component MotA